MGEPQPGPAREHRQVTWMPVAGTGGATFTRQLGQTTAGGKGWLWSISKMFPVKKIDLSLNKQPPWGLEGHWEARRAPLGYAGVGTFCCKGTKTGHHLYTVWPNRVSPPKGQVPAGMGTQRLGAPGPVGH